MALLEVVGAAPAIAVGAEIVLEREMLIFDVFWFNELGGD